ncbi:MAG: Smr/MutS family protein [Pseudomonadota bacterium]
MTSRRGELTDSERDLWNRATRDVTQRRRETPAPAVGVDAHAEGATTLRKETYNHGATSMVSPSAQKAGTAAKNDPHTVSNPFAAGDPKLDRLAARGRRPIDARLDLHGHTQASARTLLIRFIHEARNRGFRSVLIITGKGDQARGGGVLRTRFQDWVREEPLRGQISRVSQAGLRHGGAGAFYVFLKPARKTR